MNLIGENIRCLRKRVGLTQVEFSKKIGVSQGTLSDIELGNCTPSVETVLSIHERYGVTLNWILKGTEKERSANLELAESEVVQNELLHVIRLLSEKAQSEVLDFAKYKLIK
ncbi:Antitoxin PezA [compost metagenome]